MNWWSPINKSLFIFLCLALSLSSCEQWNWGGSSEGEKNVIAEVGDRKLYKETISQMDFSGESEADSLRFVDIFVDRWIRDQLLLLKAKDEMEENPKIKELVNEYKNSLLLHEYEQQVVRDRLDSNVSQQQLQEHYEEKKETYLLNHDIYRAKWILTNSSNINLDSVSVIWERDDSSKSETLSSLVELYAKSFNLSGSVWWRRDEITNNLQLSQEDWKELRLYEPQIIDKEEGRLIIYLIEKIESGQHAPLEYVEESIRRFILHQRKEEILRKLRNELYRSAVDNNKIKIY